jgi:cell division protein ZapA
MAQVNVDIAGRSYPLACREGDEPHLMALAAELGRKADSLTESLGPMSEARLLLMTALMVADELHDMRAGKAAPAAPSDPALETRLTALTARIQTLTARLDKKAAA